MKSNLIVGFLMLLPLALFPKTPLEESWLAIGPEGGRVGKIIQHPSEGNTVYAFSTDFPCRIFVSSNNGTSWSSLSTIGETINDIAIAASDAAIMYAVSYKQVYRSSDHGQSWSEIFNNENYRFSRLYVNPSNPDSIYAVGQIYVESIRYGAFFKSSNGGVTWSEKIFSEDIPSIIFAVQPGNMNTILLGGRDNNFNPILYKSVDGGQIWSDISHILDSYLEDISFAPSSPSTIYAASYYHVYHSTNSGDTWTENSDAVYTNTLAVDPSNSSIVYSGINNKVFKSIDGGIHYAEVQFDSSEIQGYYYLVVDTDNPSRIYNACSKGVYCSEDGGTTWNLTNTGLLLSEISSIRRAPSDPSTMVAAVNSDGLYKTVDVMAKAANEAAVSWTRLAEFIQCFYTSSLLIDSVDPDIIWALVSNYWKTNSALLVKSTTGGSTWTEVDSNGLYYGYILVNGSMIQGGSWDHDSDFNTPAVMGISRSTDNGATWTISSPDSTQGKIYAIAVHPDNSDIIYAGGTRSSLYQATLFKTTNGGSTWSEIGAETINQFTIITCLVIDHEDHNKLYAGTRDALLTSADGGVTWEDPPGSCTGIECMVQDSNDVNNMFIGTREGVYHSTDRGISWVELNEGMYDYPNITCLSYDAENKILYAGTKRGGVYRLMLPNTRVDEPAKLPSVPRLSQNYPNPFNGETVIKFNLPMDDEVSLVIFDIKGRLIKTLFQGRLTAGSKRVIWRGLDEKGLPLPSGIYICRLQASDQSAAIKLILQK